MIRNNDEILAQHEKRQKELIAYQNKTTRLESRLHKRWAKEEGSVTEEEWQELKQRKLCQSVMLDNVQHLAQNYAYDTNE